MQRLISKSTRDRIAGSLAATACTMLVCWSSNVMAAPPAPINISQVPMTVTIPAHPQILLALANSESMDGDLSGAIRTGSGSIPHPLLYPTSSPVNFAIPPGFTPPLNDGDGVNAPYTVNVAGLLEDNSPSRLNVAKAGLTAVLNAYIASADFGLIDYDISSLVPYDTWVYQMSPNGGFVFTNTIPGTGEYVLNPCYNVNIALPFQVAQDCAALNAYYPTQNITAQQYMLVSASSDDPSVNDVLYDYGIDPVCIVFSGPWPPTPFPPYFSLWSYETGGVGEGYGNEINSCAPYTGPTNAGFVPYSTEVMYEKRGFGYYSFTEVATDGITVVPMTSSGATPTAGSVAAAIAQFTPHLAPETNSTGTPEVKAAATQSPMAGLIAQAQTLFAGNPPTTNGCVTQRYVVLVTDGLPTMDLNHLNWPPLGSAAASTPPNGYGVSATFATPPLGDGHLISTNDQALQDVINNLTALSTAANPIKTFIIGVGAGVDPSKNPSAAATLLAMSVAGGTNTASPQGYFPATSPQAVTDALQSIITQILAETQSTASAAVNSTGLNVNSKVYQSQFVTSDTPYQDWTGNLFEYDINPSTGIVNLVTPDWSAQTQLDITSQLTPPPLPRLIATWDPTQNHAIPFEWSGGTPANGIATSTVLGTELETFTPDTNGQDVLQYLRGIKTQEVAGTPGGKFRNRSHILGDIVDSNPAYIGPSNEGLQSSSYITFEATTATRPPILYIGANDGMLHAFDVTTGNEKFAYIPQGVYANLIDLANPYYNAQHQFFVNGSPQGGDVQFVDTTWHSLLVGTEAQGGKSVYALDVTDPTQFSSEPALAGAVLWDFTDVDMGLGFSSPVIANSAAGWKVFFGNGYNSTNEKPFLYALDPQTGGASMTKIDLCAAVPTACNLAVANGLSSLIAINSSGQVAAGANLIYAGDLQGNMWRVDISNANPALWVATVLFQARDGSGNMQPITTKPVASLNPKFPQVLGTMVMFGTGQFLGLPDIANANVQSIYGVYDPPAGNVTPLVRGNLLPQTLSTALLGATPVRIITGTAPNIPTQPGWFIDLSLESGERVINDPRLETGGELVLTTYEPIPPMPGSCTATGASYFMVLNFATGGSFTTPQFDANGDGKINSSDTVVPTSGPDAGMAVAPVGISLGNVYASAPTIRSGSFGTGTGIALVTESTVGGVSNPTIQPFILKGATKSRTAWWEIRQ
jgi:type IV pilus assembly protein PilY1